MRTLKSRSSFLLPTDLWRQRFAAGLVLAGLLVTQPMIAAAHQSPPSCNGNRLNASIIKDRTQVYQGQTLTYTVTITNVDFGTDIACDITNATVVITLPAPDGTPTGTAVTLATSANYPAGTTTTVVGTAQYVVSVNPGVVDIVAEVDASGTLHDAPTDHSAQIIKTIGTSVVAPPSASTPGGSGVGNGSSIPALPNTGTAQG